jgi:integrase
MEAHLARMKKKKRAERSIKTLETEVTKYLGDWLDRPLAELTGSHLVDLHEQIKKRARRRLGTNPRNDKGAPLANRVITHVSACWNSLNRKLEGQLGNWNPAKVVDRDVLRPKRERVADEDLPTWWSKVQTLSPVRRDLNIFCMFSAMRSEAARHVRWEHVDLAGQALEVPNPKGGEDKAFRLPLGPTLMELLARRQRENVAMFAPWGGDAGFVFPTLSRAKPYVVKPLAEPKERRRNKLTGKRDNYLTGPHVSRRTYLSVASEAKITELDRSVLANHAFGNQSVNQSYIEQAFPHLMECQSKIDAALLSRMGVQAVLPTGAPAGALTAQLATQESTSALE